MPDHVPDMSGNAASQPGDPTGLPTRHGPRGEPLSPLAGAVCGLLAAVGYTVANSLLRASVDLDPVWVSTLKAAPIVAGTLPFLLLMRWQGRPLADDWTPLPMLVVAVLVGQFGGNVAFQIALGTIGLALSVPIALGTMITGGAVLGRWMLGEPVTGRTVLSIIILTLAVTVLSLGGPGALAGSTAPAAASFGGIALGGLIAAGAGVAYAFMGTTMRHSFRRGMSVPMAMFVSGAVGSSALAAAAWWRIGGRGILATSDEQWAVMLAAGVFNLLAFFALSLSLKAIPVVAVNLLNASQAAMAALAGIAFFGEPFSWPLQLGLVMTVAGLLVLSGRRPQPRALAADDRQKPMAQSSAALATPRGAFVSAAAKRNSDG